MLKNILNTEIEKLTWIEEILVMLIDLLWFNRMNSIDKKAYLS